MNPYKMPLATIVALGACDPALAAPGELDAGFGRNGLAAFGRAYAAAAVQQPDGKLLIAATNAEVWRINPDGSPDRSFANSGMANVTFGQRTEAADLALMADGRIVVVGTARLGASSLFTIARLLPDGALDRSFDGDGRATIDVGRTWQSISSVVASADGRIVVAGTVSGTDGYDMVFMRLHHDGGLDLSFGDGSFYGTTIVNSGLDDYPNQLIALPDGKYLACGYADRDELVYVGTMLAVRLNHDGSLDRGFGADGFARLETAARGYSSAAEACLALSDGSIVLAGWELREAGHPAALLMRLRSDGLRDRGAWSDGLATPELGRAQAHAIVEIDGGFAISGALVRTFWGVAANDAYVARIDGVSGSLDRSFGHDGVTTTDFNRDETLATDATFSTLVRQADGKLVTAGGTWFNEGMSGWPEMIVARVDPHGVGHPGIAGFVEPGVWVEGNEPAVVTVRRTGGSLGTLLVDFETVNRSAIAPRDYTHTRGTLTWVDADVTPKTIEVPITPGAVPVTGAPQPEKRFDVLLSTSASSLARAGAWVCLGHGCNSGVPTAASGSSVSGGSSAPPVSGARVTGGSGGGALGSETLLLLVATLLSHRWRQGRFRRCMNET